MKQQQFVATHREHEHIRFKNRGVAYLPHTLQGNSSLARAACTEPGGMLVAGVTLECDGV